MLPEDLLDIIWRYRHELTFAPTLRKIENMYAEHKAEVDRVVHQMWDEWVFLHNARVFQPEIYAPGGEHHQMYLTKWFPLRLRLRRSTTRDRLPGIW